ncbi:hypothetical protein GOV10_04775 [Candidatus Woesearchaeota archaeon]|nr:hypothetical protein [Candidatus Woesearchaeota archaeon]
MQGFLKYFFHSPDTNLPIPDVQNMLGYNNKSEYHLIGQGLAAENWVKTCQQHTIKLAKEGDVLFWLTKNRHRPSPQFNDQYIIGYLSVEQIILRSNTEKSWTSVLGQGNLFSFTDAISIKDIYGYNLSRGHISKYKRLEGEQTAAFLEHFAQKENIYEKCLEAIVARADEKTCFEGCELKDVCTR